MNLYYCRTENGNFGDDINFLLWKQLLPDIVNTGNPITMGGGVNISHSDNPIFLGVGTLINDRVPEGPRKVVFGAGAGYGQIPIIDEKWKFYFVRGHLSAKLLGLDGKQVVTDGAYAITGIEEFLKSREKRHAISFIPHHHSAFSSGVRLMMAINGINFIEPTGDIYETIREIKESALVVTEALHGAVIADALRVPWIPVKLRGDVYDFKWEDWCSSLRIKYRPIIFSGYEYSLGDFVSRAKRRISLVSNTLTFRKLISSSAYSMSTDFMYREITERIGGLIYQIRKDFHN